jgi:hypothetical protein
MSENAAIVAQLIGIAMIVLGIVLFCLGTPR